MIKLVNIKNEENINIVNNIINYNAPEKIYVPVSNPHLPAPPFYGCFYSNYQECTCK